MNKKIKKLQNYKKMVFTIFCMAIFLFIGFLLISKYYEIQKNINENNSTSLDMIDQRMKNVITKVNNFPSSAADEILVLSYFSNFKDFINASQKERQEMGFKIENDFLEFLKQSSAYYQLRYIDETGQEIIRVEHDGSGKYKIVGHDKLQNKKDRYYFQQAMKLKKDGVFISQLDLNVEDGQIENRGTEKYPEYVPVMRYAIGIFDKDDQKKGILVANVYADYFLDDIRELSRNGDMVMLINQNGYYLAHPEKEKEYGFMFGNDENFFTDYPEITRQIIEDKTGLRAKSNKWIATYEYITPQESSFEIYKGFEDRTDEYYWILVNLTPVKDVQRDFTDFLKSYVSFIVFNLGFAFLAIYLTFWLGFKKR